MENQFTTKATEILTKIQSLVGKLGKLGDTLAKYGEALRKEGVNRKQFADWLDENCALGRTQRFFVLGSVYPADDSKKRGGKKKDPELQAMAEALLEYAVGEFGDKARSVLLASYKLAKSED